MVRQASLARPAQRRAELDCRWPFAPIPVRLISYNPSADDLDIPSFANPPSTHEIPLEDRADHGALGFEKQVVWVFGVAVQQ
jgi:hypothetical protein